MTQILYVHTDSDTSVRTSTPSLRPKTAEVRGSHHRPTQTRSVADSDCIRLDLCRWETEGGALIGTDCAGSTGSCCTGNDILQTDSQTVQLANLGSPSNRLADALLAWSRPNGPTKIEWTLKPGGAVLRKDRPASASATCISKCETSIARSGFTRACSTCGSLSTQDLMHFSLLARNTIASRWKKSVRGRLRHRGMP
jgi:hypothetical protein